MTVGARWNFLHLTWIMLSLCGGALFMYRLALALVNRSLIDFVSSERYLLGVFPLLSFSLFLFHGRHGVEEWDEFSHWALVSKSLILTDALPTVSSNVIFKDYPEGSGLFHYFISRFFSGFHESLLYYAQSLLIFSFVFALLLPPFATKDRWVRGAQALFFVGGVAYYYKVGKVYSTLLVDQLLGCMFAFLLVCSWYEAQRKKGPGWPWGSLILLFTFPLIKKSGLFLALLGGAGILISYAYHQRPRFRGWILLVGLLGSLPILSQYLWSSWVSENQFARVFPVRASASVLRAIWDPSQSDSFQIQVLSRFATAMTETPVGRYFDGLSAVFHSPVSYATLFMSFGLFAAFICGKGRSFLAAKSIYLLAGFGAFHFGLLYLYLTSFVPHEALELASFERYSTTYILGWGLLLFCMIQHVLATQVKWTLTLGLLFTVLIAASTPWRELKLKAAGRSPISSELKSALSRIEQKTPVGSRILFIAQESKGFEIFVANYELAPQRKVNVFDFWWIVPPHRAVTPWTTPLSQDELKVRILYYQFVYLLKLDENFCADYRLVFGADECQEGRLFAVEAEHHRYKQLVPISE
ncbi:MAG: hypothetical protein AB7G93_07345 [Bdellovibrionales bacterium]